MRPNVQLADRGQGRAATETMRMSGERGRCAGQRREGADDECADG